MQVDKVSFKGVYRETGKHFSPKQYIKSQVIMNSMNNVGINGYTSSEVLEKKGYDVLIVPVENDCVDVYAVEGFEKGVGDKPHTYKHSKYVKTYDEKTEFHPSDIKKAISEKGLIGAILLLPIIGISALINLAVLKDCDKVQVRKQNIENIIPNDSVKTIAQDTVKFIKK